MQPTSAKPTSANGEQIKILGEIDIEVRLGKGKQHVPPAGVHLPNLARLDATVLVPKLK